MEKCLAGDASHSLSRSRHLVAAVDNMSENASRRFRVRLRKRAQTSLGRRLETTTLDCCRKACEALDGLAERDSRNFRINAVMSGEAGSAAGPIAGGQGVVTR